MYQLLIYGALCALAPWLLARLHPVLGGVTRPLVYLLVAGQLLIVPVLVARDPDIDFGSDTYSLGAGIGIVLVGGIWLVFAAGSAVGFIAATAYIRRREEAQASAQWARTLAELEANDI